LLKHCDGLLHLKPQIFVDQNDFDPVLYK
jgi:hypothetical protein